MSKSSQKSWILLPNLTAGRRLCREFPTSAVGHSVRISRHVLNMYKSTLRREPPTQAGQNSSAWRLYGGWCTCALFHRWTRRVSTGCSGHLVVFERANIRVAIDRQISKDAGHGRNCSYAVGLLFQEQLLLPKMPSFWERYIQPTLPSMQTSFGPTQTRGDRKGFYVFMCVCFFSFKLYFGRLGRPCSGRATRQAWTSVARGPCWSLPYFLDASARYEASNCRYLECELVHPSSERKRMSLAKATSARVEVRTSNRVFAQLDWDDGNSPGR